MHWLQHSVVGPQGKANSSIMLQDSNSWHWPLRISHEHAFQCHVLLTTLTTIVRYYGIVCCFKAFCTSCLPNTIKSGLFVCPWSSHLTCLPRSPATQHSHLLSQTCCSQQDLVMLQEAQCTSTNMAEEKAGPVMQPSAANSGQEDAERQEVTSSSGSAAADPFMPASSGTSTSDSHQV